MLCVRFANHKEIGRFRLLESSRPCFTYENASVNEKKSASDGFNLNKSKEMIRMICVDQNERRGAGGGSQLVILANSRPDRKGTTRGSPPQMIAIVCRATIPQSLYFL